MFRLNIFTFVKTTSDTFIKHVANDDGKTPRMIAMRLILIYLK